MLDGDKVAHDVGVAVGADQQLHLGGRRRVIPAPPRKSDHAKVTTD